MLYAIWTFTALCITVVASNRGKNFMVWFAYSIVFCPVALLHITVLELARLKQT